MPQGNYTITAVATGEDGLNSTSAPVAIIVPEAVPSGALWKYLDDLVGKGLDFITIGKFLWYVSASMLTLAMPIAILISTIMTFGNLGESFELVAVVAFENAGHQFSRGMRMEIGRHISQANAIVAVAFAAPQWRRLHWQLIGGPEGGAA